MILFASGEIDLQAVGEVFGGMDAGASADSFESSGEEGAHAVGGGLVVAGGFDLDEFADGLDDLLPAGFEVAQALGPDGTVGGSFGFARDVLISSSAFFTCSFAVYFTIFVVRSS